MTEERFNEICLRIKRNFHPTDKNKEGYYLTLDNEIFLGGNRRKIFGSKSGAWSSLNQHCYYMTDEEYKEAKARLIESGRLKLHSINED